jgi:hypothetical protein
VQVKKLVDMLATPEDVDEFNQMIDQRKKRLENEAHTNNSGKF